MCCCKLQRGLSPPHAFKIALRLFVSTRQFALVGFNRFSQNSHPRQIRIGSFRNLQNSNKKQKNCLNNEKRPAQFDKLDKQNFTIQKNQLEKSFQFSGAHCNGHRQEQFFEVPCADKSANLDSSFCLFYFAFSQFKSREQVIHTRVAFARKAVAQILFPKHICFPQKQSSVIQQKMPNRTKFWHLCPHLKIWEFLWKILWPQCREIFKM